MKIDTTNSTSQILARDLFLFVIYDGDLEILSWVGWFGKV
jgi:hypothetical protein